MIKFRACKLKVVKMYSNLKAYIDTLEKEGELIRISEMVSSSLQIAELTDRECKSAGGGKAILFENNGSPFPVITNMYGSDRRIALALKSNNLSELGERITKLFATVTAPKKGLLDKLKMLSPLSEVAGWMPKKVRGYGECQQMVMLGDDVDLSLLPILKCAPLDGGRFITLPMVNTICPKSGIANSGMYRMQVLDDKTTAMHWHCHKTGERHYSAYKELGELMPVTVCLGGDPAYTYSATAPLPDGIDEYMLAGFIRKKGVKMVRSITNNIYIPNDCDFVIEGYVDPSEEKFYEGPFGDHTGYYSLEDYYPKFHVTCITHRRDAIYPATIVGVPPMEDVYIAKATESIFIAPIKLVMQPDINDMWLPEEGVAHNLAILNIDKTYIGQPQKVAASMWGAGQMMFNKFSIITALPSGKSIRDIEVLKSLVDNIDIERDVTIMRGTLDVLDHTASVMGYGGKLSIDTTNQNNNREVRGFSGTLTDDIESYLESWGAIILYADDIVSFKDRAVEVIDSYNFKGLKFVVLLNHDSRYLNISEKLWLLCSNCDAYRDTYIYNGTLVLDARVKAGGVNGFERRWPNIVVMDEATIKEVDDILFRSNLEVKESPSKRYMPLFRGENVDI